MTGREYHWRIAGRDVVARIEGGVLHLGDQAIPFTVNEGIIEVNGVRHEFFVHRHRDETSVWLDGRTYRLEHVTPGRAADSAAGASSDDVRSRMPGKILRIDVAVGDPVTAKQTLITMESMKMETAIVAPRAGTIKEVRCQVGQVVDMGELLVTME